MNVYFQTKNIEVHSDFKDFIAHRMRGLDKFFSPTADAYIDLERTNFSHNGEDLYYVSIKINDPEQKYFVKEYRENLRKSFDDAFDNIFRSIRSERGKLRDTARRTATKIKRMFKRQR